MLFLLCFRGWDDYVTRVSPLSSRDFENWGYAAVQYETGKYDECLETVKEVLSKRLDYTVKAKYAVIPLWCRVGNMPLFDSHPHFLWFTRALTRRGNAYVAQNKLAEAIEAYKAALVEHRTPDTLKRLQDVRRHCIKTRSDRRSHARGDA